MMYLSQLILNYETHLVIKDLANPYDLHRRVMSGFPMTIPPGERVLYRLEINRHEPWLTLLVQSRTKPDWAGLTSCEYTLFDSQIKEFEYHLSDRGICRFRLYANPTKRIRKDKKESGLRVALLREEDQINWLVSKGEKGGFSVLQVTTAKIPRPDGVKEIKGTKHFISCTQVSFNGLLQITDVDKFKKVCVDGIGSGKSFGCGLLSIASE